MCRGVEAIKRESTNLIMIDASQRETSGSRLCARAVSRRRLLSAVERLAPPLKGLAVSSRKWFARVLCDAVHRETDTFNDKQSQIAERKTGDGRGPGDHSREAVRGPRPTQSTHGPWL